jgi:hypothetical protein
VNVYVRTIDIAQRLLDSMLLGFADDPRVLRIANAHRYAKLERHVEPRRSRSIRIELHTRHVVNGILGRLDERNDPFEAPLTKWDFQCGSGDEPKALSPEMYARRRFSKALVVGNVEKNRAPANVSIWPFSTLPGSSWLRHSVAGSCSRLHSFVSAALQS